MKTSRILPSGKVRCSVVMATFNGEKFISEQLKSIVTQLEDHDELIIVDDHSEDSSKQIIQNFQKIYPQIRLFTNKENIGPVKTFEKGFKLANGKIIVPCDQDDVWLDNKIEKISEALQKFDLVMTNGRVVDQNLNNLNINLKDFVRFKSGFIKNFISNTYVGCSMGFRRELLEISLPFTCNVPYHDWLIGLVGEAFFKCTFLEEELFLFRRHSSNQSTTGKKSKNSFSQKIASRIALAISLVFSFLRLLRFRILK